MCIYMYVCVFDDLSFHYIDYLLVIILFSLNLRVAKEKRTPRAKRELSHLSFSLQREREKTYHPQVCRFFFPGSISF